MAAPNDEDQFGTGEATMRAPEVWTTKRRIQGRGIERNLPLPLGDFDENDPKGKPASEFR